MIITLLSFLFLLTYSILMLYLAVNNSKIDDELNPPYREAAVTIIISFRNEAENLPNLLGSILTQNYPSTQVEILFLDDHSTDDSIRILNEQLKDTAIPYRIIQLEAEEGKKQAIKRGVKEATHNIILITDADCWMSKRWISSMVNTYLQFEAVLVAGPVVLESKGSELLGRLQEIEFAALAAITSATVNLNNPILCNAANLAFSKSVFLEVDPYSDNRKVASGDDIFLLQELKKHPIYRNKIHFANRDEAIVRSETKASLQEFIQQRIRWAAKGKYYSDRSMISTAWLIFLMNVSVILLFIGTLSQTVLFSYFLSVFIIKWIVDYLLIRSAPSWFNKSRLLIKSLALSLVYPLYTILVAFLSLLYRPEWKGRKI